MSSLLHASGATPALAPCPDKPNCVSSQATDRQHAIEPFSFSDDPATAWTRLKNVLQQQPRTRIITAQGTYLHAEFRSLVFRFVDDVEFVMQPEQQIIQLRSASRTGYSDFGVNRRRIEQLRKLFSGAVR
ncbi:MAG: DUF1499 domain-containing protein [Pseudomonadota bacterium]